MVCLKNCNCKYSKLLNLYIDDIKEWSNNSKDSLVLSVFAFMLATFLSFSLYSHLVKSSNYDDYDELENNYKLIEDY